MKGRESARKKQDWKAKVKKAAVAGYIELHGYTKSSGGLHRCMHDVAIKHKALCSLSWPVAADSGECTSGLLLISSRSD